jgi:CHAD domain-containing protein/CYTH domain-containing protein
MGLEIERKFRLDSTQLLTRLLDEGLRAKEKRLCQVYTHIAPTEQERIRFDGDRYIKTQKRGQGIAREETESEVSKETFEAAKEHALGVPIEKQRFYFKMQSFEACIDVFKGALKGLVVLEVEFDTLEAANAFALPPTLQAQEITEDERYKNHALALYGLPLSHCTLSALFEAASACKLDVAQIDGTLPAYAAFRVIFYDLYAKIERHKHGYLETKENEHLHQFRVHIRKTRSLLQSLSGLLDEGIAKRFIDGFKTIATQTNTKRDLDVFHEFLQTIDASGAIALHVEAARSGEDDKISIALRENFYEGFLLEWKMVLEDEEGFFKGPHATLSFKEMGARALKARIHALGKKLTKLDEAQPLEKFHKVRIEFKRLRYLLEYLAPHFAAKPLKKAAKKAKAMQEVFGVLQDRDVQSQVLEAIQSHAPLCEDVEVVAATEALQALLRHEIYALRLQILRKKKHLVKHLRACQPLLEPYCLNPL